MVIFLTPRERFNFIFSPLVLCFLFFQANARFLDDISSRIFFFLVGQGEGNNRNSTYIIDSAIDIH